ncbi:MAG: chromosome partitioning protein [Rhodothermales bacterium]|jgi:chromosome partitioning protein
MIPITICNHKGGTGKTTSTIMIAAGLGLSGHRVLVVDLDPQGFLTRMMGVPEPGPEKSSCMLFSDDGVFDPESIVQLGSFGLLPASARLSTDLRRLNRSIDVLWAKEFTEANLGGWDYVIYDTAAALTVFTLNALVASQHVIIPVLPEYQPVVGAEQTYQTSLTIGRKLNPDLAKPLLLITMVDARKRNHQAYEAYLRERYGDQVLNTRIRTSAALSTTRHDGQTAFEFDPRGRGVMDYAAAVDELDAIVAARKPEVAEIS